MMAPEVEKTAMASKKWRMGAITIGVGVLAGVADVACRRLFGTGLPDQVWDLIGSVAMTYLGAQGAVDLGVRVSAILRGKTTAEAIEAAEAAAVTEVGAMTPAEKADALARP